MAISLKHAFNCTKADGNDATAVKPSDWNAQHTFTAAPGKVLGTRTDSTTVTELPIAVDASGNVGVGVEAPAAKFDIGGTLGINGQKGTSGQALVSSGPSVAPTWGAVGIVGGGTGASTAAAARENLGLGSAATQNVGTAANNVVQLDASAKLPAVDASQLINLPVSFAMPSGVIMPFAGTSEPAGWLFAFGQALSRTTYAGLFAAIGTTYGTGDGVTTFNLPDLRGRVIAGQDDMGGVSANRLTNQAGGVDGDVLGATGGAETHTLTIAQMPAHTHSVSNTLLPGASGQLSNATQIREIGTTTSGSTGGGGAHNNIQPTIILNYLIKT